MSEFFSEGGWTMFPTAFFGALAVLCSMLIASKPERRFVPLFLSLNALTLMAGVVGTMVGVSGVVRAATNAEPSDLKAIVSACAIQALNSLTLASMLVAVALLGATAGALRLARGSYVPATSSR
jgi:hypothetical protein